MKPSPFLKKRFGECLKGVSGEQTVYYFAFDSASEDSLTGDVDESQAYPGEGVPLPALVEFQPSQAMRERIGLEIDFDATLMMATQHLTESGITLKIGDAFLLPEETEKSVIKRIIKGKQAGNEFLDQIIALKRGIGRRK
jgi:hypothetical protein